MVRQAVEAVPRQPVVTTSVKSEKIFRIVPRIVEITAETVPAPVRKAPKHVQRIVAVDSLHVETARASQVRVLKPALKIASQSLWAKPVPILGCV